MTADFYDLLEIPPDASQDEIKEAYREKVRTYHPDVNDDPRARSQFTAVKKANDILGDPVERRAYDRLGHEEYVSKRTSGIPSPDVWADTDGSSSESSSRKSTSTSASRTTNETSTGSTTTTNETSTGSTTTTNETSTGSKGATNETSTSSKRTTNETSTRSKRTGRTKSHSRGDDANESATSRRQTTGSAKTSSSTKTSSSKTGSAKTSSSTTDGRGVGSTDGGTTHGRGRTHTTGRRTGQSGSSRRTATAAGTEPGSTAPAVVRWWRRRNLALPLIWLSVLVYAVGLAQFVWTNEAAVETLRVELVAVGTSVGGLWGVLSSGRYGLETPFEFVTAVDPVTPPLEPTQWYATLAAVVVGAVALVAVARLIRKDQLWGPISIDETILLAAALATSTGLLGGPLLAGAILMPFLFCVVLYHTRRGPGWKPSYLYVAPVLAPAAGLALGAAGYATLSIELVAFVVLPLVGALGLPLRATIRKHVGR
ncbi:J domain-containing protein [Natrarchaeobius chitinivorans]|uniref:J domain-containing protein n=1 Tax=Natrarchaeobius chitinivorans TaxID=1679083 RepID=A0A3N6M2R6_NATCH|nr:DnaJ domain-containing protein [Natrarchaeobius chitinivorans]RQG97723.1 J domain-containing protein [Natrarchaeobius chitinivorans]